MESAMWWDKSSERGDFSSEASVQKFRAPVCDVVRAEKSRGIKAALAHAAGVFGLPYNRVRSAWYGEVRAPLAYEMDLVRRGYRRWVDERCARLEREIEQLELIAREIDGK